MKPVIQLELGFSDAENYRLRPNKELFNRIFVRDYSLEKLLSHNTHFLIGEKGTGKTAYAVYLANNHYMDTVAQLKFIRETEYKKFLRMKREKHLDISDFSSIWKVIILLLLAMGIDKKEVDALPFNKSTKIKNLWEAVDKFYMNAFSPEISSAMRFVDESNLSAKLISEFLHVGAAESSTVEIGASRLQINLLYIEKQFKEAINSIRLKENHILFIDGIDVRPEGIPYPDYLNCIKGLADATWSLNNDFFANIKDSKGRLRVVLLLRPDIYNSLGLQNSTNKLKDNSVFLDWRTTYPEYRSSNLFQVVDKVLSVQQDNEMEVGEAWDYYFNWRAPHMVNDYGEHSSFISFLRYSYSRPRDVLSAMQIMQAIVLERNLTKKRSFAGSDFTNNDYKNRFSQYLMGGIKDQLSFYYDENDYSGFVAFFDFLKGKREFDYQEYCLAYERFMDYVFEHLQEIPEFVDSKEIFLQFLYDTNILCYIEDGDFDKFFRWCYRERSLSNIAPKVKLHSRYKIHNALEKALNVGGQDIR